MMETFVQWGIDFMVGISNNVSELDGRIAFVTGAVSWFLVEQAIRRLAGIIRIAILLGFLAALGYGIWQILPIIQGGSTP
ncbi:MAG: hypothetical protein ACPG40_12390 [Alphaproteobacteria bacterium]